jgi:hypothetical protein
MSSPTSINSEATGKELSKPEPANPKKDPEISKEDEEMSAIKKPQVMLISLM